MLQGKQRWFSLADVGKVIQSLTMDRYKAPYQDLEEHHKGRRNTKDLSEDIPDMSQSKLKARAHYIPSLRRE